MAEKIVRKRIRSCDDQMDCLINYMLTHKSFAVGKFLTSQGKKTSNDQWKVLTDQLNEMGPKKTIEQWKKVWKNQKILTRKRASEVKIAERRTGNFPAPPPLSEKERKILSIIGVQSSEGLGFGEGLVSGLVDTVVTESNCASNNLRDTNDVVEDVVLDSVDFPEAIEEVLIGEDDHSYSVTNTSLPIQSVVTTPVCTSQRQPPKKATQQSLQLDQYSDLIRGTNEGLEKIADALSKIGDTMAGMAEVLKQFFESRNRQ